MSRINTATNKVVGTTTVGRVPLSVATGGNRVYTANQSANTVSVTDGTKVVATVTVGPAPTSVKLSPDASLAYVTNANDTVSVIDTRTNTVVRTVGIDAAPESGPHSVAVSRDGATIYVTDTADQTVRIFTIGRVNSAPTGANWGVGGLNSNTGIVTGQIFANDPDGDPLTYTVTAGPANNSTVTLTTTGAFTFTPSAVARNLAAQTTSFDVDHFTVTISDGIASTSTTVEVPVAPSPVGHPPRAAKPDFVTNAADGTVIGSLNVIDPDGDPLTYTVTGTPTRGSVSLALTGQFVYTPSLLARNQAAQTPGVDNDSFSVRVTDGTTNVDVTVSVPVAPAYLTSTPIGVGNYPYRVVVAGNHIYVANLGDNSVSVIERSTKTLVKTIDVGDSPLGLAAKPDGSRIYVSNHADGATDVPNTVTVINTATNTVVATIAR